MKADSTTIDSRRADKRPPATFVGVLPGPRNGMTLFTEAIVETLRQRFDLREFDIGRAYHESGRRWRLARSLRSLWSALWLLLKSRRGASEFVYLVANSSGGLFFNLLQALAARGRGYRIVLHHHVYAYINAYDWRVNWLLKIASDRGLHIVACKMMGEDLDRRYRFRGHYATMAPSMVSARRMKNSLPATVDDRPQPPPFVIGHLSNLTVEKGVGEVIETVHRLIDAGLAIRCVLAGPVASNEAKQLIDAAVSESPEVFEWRGAVYGAAKQRFFAEIHTLLFPTRYRNESWGMVLDEALAAGVPPITYRAGCTPHLMGVLDESCAVGGVVVDPADSLPPIAAATIQQWINQPEQYAKAAQAARERSDELSREGEEGLVCLLAELLPQTTAGTGDKAGSRLSMAAAGGGIRK